MYRYSPSRRQVSGILPLFARQCPGNTAGVSRGKTVAHAFAGGSAFVRCGDTTSRGQQAVYLDRHQGAVGNLMHLHLRYAHKTNVQPPAPPGHGVIEPCPIDRVFLAEHIATLNATRFAHADAGRGAQQFTVLDPSLAKFTHGLDHLYGLPAAETLGLGKLFDIRGIEVAQITGTRMVDVEVLAIRDLL